MKHEISLSDRELTYIILALDSYEKELLNDEADPGPSFNDAIIVSYLAKKLRAIHAGKDNKAL